MNMRNVVNSFVHSPAWDGKTIVPVGFMLCLLLWLLLW